MYLIVGLGNPTAKYAKTATTQGLTSLMRSLINMELN